MIRAALGFLLVWGVVFFGLSYIWHTSLTEKLNMIRIGFYSFLTAIITMAIMVAFVVMF